MGKHALGDYHKCKECRQHFIPDIELMKKVNAPQVFCTTECARAWFGREYRKRDAARLKWMRAMNRERRRAGEPIPYPEVARKSA